MSGEEHGWSLGQVRVVGAVPELGGEQPHTFAPEKKAEKERSVQSETQY
jgi:hypothetical protein